MRESKVKVLESLGVLADQSKTLLFKARLRRLPVLLRGEGEGRSSNFPCFTSTKVQMLTQILLFIFAKLALLTTDCQVHVYLRGLLVQKYKY